MTKSLILCKVITEPYTVKMIPVVTLVTKNHLGSIIWLIALKTDPDMTVVCSLHNILLLNWHLMRVHPYPGHILDQERCLGFEQPWQNHSSSAGGDLLSPTSKMVPVVALSQHIIAEPLSGWLHSGQIQTLNHKLTSKQGAPPSRLHSRIRDVWSSASDNCIGDNSNGYRYFREWNEQSHRSFLVHLLQEISNDSFQCPKGCDLLGSFMLTISPSWILSNTVWYKSYPCSPRERK